MDFIALSITITYGVLSIALIISLIRVIIGPTLPDRVVALDLVAFIAIGFIATFSIDSNQPAYMDAAIVLALIAFLGTIAFARYVMQTQVGNKED